MKKQQSSSRSRSKRKNNSSSEEDEASSESSVFSAILATSSSSGDSDDEPLVVPQGSPTIEKPPVPDVKVLLDRIPSNPTQWMKQYNLKAIRNRDGEVIEAKESDGSSPEKPQRTKSISGEGEESPPSSSMSKRRSKKKVQFSKSASSESSDGDANGEVDQQPRPSNSKSGDGRAIAWSDDSAAEERAQRKSSSSKPGDEDGEESSRTSKRRSKKTVQFSKSASASSDGSDEEEEEGDKPSNSKNRDQEDSDFEMDATKDGDDGDEGEDEKDDDDDEGHSSDSEIIPVKRKRVHRDRDRGDEAEEKSSPDATETKKKKRRVKQMTDSEDEDSDSKEGKVKRKNIRRVMKDRDLEADTKRAEEIEMARRKRVEERQKLFNEITDEKPEQVKVMESLVLDVEEDEKGEKKELLWVDKKLVRKLKPHQGAGIRFMFNACFESLKRMETETGSGCILAHCMGLGKTLQVVTLVHTLLTASERTNVHRVLVICPLSTVLNWVNEFQMWLEHVEENADMDVYELSKFKQNNDRARIIAQWHKGGGVLVMGYDLFRNLSNEKGARLKKKAREQLQMGLVDPGPDLVICDEGHLLKNEKTSLSKAVNKIRSLRRVVLTGTPLQNNLKEYYCMVQFVKPNLLGKYTEYLNRFVNPITNGQYNDSTQQDIEIMKRRSHVLHKLLDGCVQRRDYNVLAPFLPPKLEYVLSIRLTEMQVKLYKYYIDNISQRRAQADSETAKKSSMLFADYQNLQRIWTHPRVLRYNSDRYHVVQMKKLMDASESEGSIKDFLDDDDDDDLDEDEEVGGGGGNKTTSEGDSDDSDARPLGRVTRGRAATKPELYTVEGALEEQKVDNPTEWWMEMVPEPELDNLAISGKLMLLFSILEECEAIGDKLLVFSQSIFSLDVIEHFLSLADADAQSEEKNPMLKGFSQSWSMGLDYFRLDGSTTIENRNLACKAFNRETNTRARLFLISTRAGGLGINLVAANRVVIFDASWNPSYDVQSIFRVYRFGQQKPCYIYRFLALGTMEEKIYERQVTKQAISKRVLDEQQIDRHYKENDLLELYNHDLEPETEREVPILPRDRLFAGLLKRFDDLIYKYHEHDSLLENKEEETLNEEERKAAWDEFEAEKTRPQINYAAYTGSVGRPASGPVTSNNIFGFRTDILLQLLNLKARKENPAMTDAQVNQVIPYLVQQLYRQMANNDLSVSRGGEW